MLRRTVCACHLPLSSEMLAEVTASGVWQSSGFPRLWRQPDYLTPRSALFDRLWGCSKAGLLQHPCFDALVMQSQQVQRRTV